MKKTVRVPDYLGHILQAIDRIQQYTRNVDIAGFLADEMLQDAVIRNIEVIGEAANNIQRRCRICYRTQRGSLACHVHHAQQTVARL